MLNEFRAVIIAESCELLALAAVCSQAVVLLVFAYCVLLLLPFFVVVLCNNHVLICSTL